MTALSAHAVALRNIIVDIKENPGNMEDYVVSNVSGTLGGIAKLFETLGDEPKCLFCETPIEKAGSCKKCMDEIFGREATV